MACENCRYKDHSQGGHCYMFVTKPLGRCMQYRERQKSEKVCDDTEEDRVNVEQT